MGNSDSKAKAKAKCEWRVVQRARGVVLVCRDQK